MVMVRQWRCADCNKCTTIMQDADGGGGCACVGQQEYGNSVLSAQFCCESETSEKQFLKNESEIEARQGTKMREYSNTLSKRQG